MARESLSTMTRLVEARAQLRQARKAAAADQPELAASLAEIMADVDELRWVLTNEGPTGWCRGDDRREGGESGGNPE